MELIKETILGAMITVFAEGTQVIMADFLSKYEGLFERYVDYPKLKGLLERSEPAENWNIIQQAKRLALCSNDVRGYNPLCSVFSNLSLDDSYPAKKYYAPTTLDMENIMPRSETWNYGYENLIQNFYDELEKLMHAPPKGFDAFLVIMDTLLKKYWWSIPASGKKDEDASLYDYIRTSVAIAAVLTRTTQNDAEGKPYIMAAGHFSGIQRYIFSVSKVGAGGVAKRLRARSFYVNAMVSALAHRIIHKFGLPVMNILMLTGGKFYILLPNTAEAETELHRIEEQTAAFLYEKFKGNLSLELVWEKFAEDGIVDYSATVAELASKIEREKERPLESVLINGEEWNTEQFAVYQDLSNKSMCASCRSALVDEGKEMCPNCETDTEIGGKLPKIKIFSFSRKKGQYKLLDGYYLNLDTSVGGEDNYFLMKLNDPSLFGMYDRPVSVQFVANNVPLHEGEVKTFGEIADEARGSKKLGILKADVDTLGFLFSNGLQGEDNRPVSIARVNTMSRLLELFFGGYLQHLLERKYRNVYCVFSGGDDLFLIGSWNDMPALAIELNRKFHEYTGYNPCMTLSAAICMAESGGHISTLAERCEDKLKQVKQEADRIISPEKSGRNGIYFLGKVITWEDFEELIKRGEDFAKISAKLGTGVFRRLATYSGMYQDYLINKDVEKLEFLPLFSNDMMRNHKTFAADPHFLKYCNDLYKKASNYRKTDKQFYYMEFCVRYALMLTREERKE